MIVEDYENINHLNKYHKIKNINLIQCVVDEDKKDHQHVCLNK